MSSPARDGSFKIKSETVPRVRVEGNAVYVRLELHKINETSGQWDIELVLHPALAKELGTELTEQAMKAR